MIRKAVVGFALGAIVLAVAGAWWVRQRVEGAYLDSDGVPIHYTEQGAGDPLVLIHGLAMDADLEWRANGLVDAFARDYRAIVIDNRGRGLSGRPLGSEHYGTAMVDDVVRGFAGLAIGEAELRANEVPTILIAGTRDPLQPDVDRLDGVMQAAEIVYVEGGDHGSTESSDVFLEIARAFLR